MDIQQNLLDANIIKAEVADPDEELSLSNTEMERPDIGIKSEDSAVGGADSLKETLIKTELKSEETEEILKYELLKHESFTSFDMSENLATTLKFQIKSEDMDISYPSPETVADANSKEWQKFDTKHCSTGGDTSNIKSDTVLPENCFSFSCIHCDYATNLRSSLVKHMLVHSKGKQKLFLCANCDFSTICRQDLVQHISVHNKGKEKTFSCSICGFKTHHKTSLTRHFHLHSENYERHSCTCCKKYYTTKQLLDDHIIKKHQNFIELVSSKVHNCSMCNYKTTMKYLLRCHMVKVHHEKHSCTCCEKHFTDKQLLDNHIIKNHPNFINLVNSKVYNCPTCDYKTTRKAYLRLHTKKVHSENYKKLSCMCCEKRFKDKKLLDNHVINNHQSSIDSVSSRVYNCPTCDYKTTIEEYLKRHMTNIHSENYDFSCAHCEKRFRRKTDVDEHIIKNHQDFIDPVSNRVHSCSECEYKTAVKCYLKRHVTRVHSGNDMLSCRYCEKHFKRKIFLDNHILQNHQNFIESVSSNVYSCPTCEYKTTVKGHLRRHTLKIHSGNYRTHSCTYCEKHYTTKQLLDGHIIKHHKNFIDLVSSKVHNCPTCDYKTIIKRELKQHVIKVHSGKYEKHFCTYCDKHFKNIKSLDNHVIKNHQNVPVSVSSKVHNCPTCDYKTTLKSYLRYHIKNVHLGNYEKHPCTYCEKRFKRKVLLDEHIIQHHQNFIDSVTSKLHNCPTCDYKTAITAYLKRHMLKVHSESDDRHSCTSCDKYFKDRKSLDDHVLKNHLDSTCDYKTTVTSEEDSRMDITSYKCNNCQYLTFRKSSYTRHVNIHCKVKNFPEIVYK